jgi:hypothetical protein
MYLVLIKKLKKQEIILKKEFEIKIWGKPSSALVYKLNILKMVYWYTNQTMQKGY